MKDNSGNGNGDSGNNGNDKENSKSEGTDDAGYGNATNAEEHNSQNQSGILFPAAEEISRTETDLIAMIKTTGKEKDYELIEYILNVNTQYTQVLMELNENGAMDAVYTYGVSRLTEDRFTGESNFYLYDPSGNVAGITDQNGYLWQSYRYDAFGNATFGSPQYDNEYTFNAESYNPNIRSQYLRARYYDMVKGNFLTEDSYLGDIRNPLTLNRYSYCIGNPLFYDDPSGHDPKDYELPDYAGKIIVDFANDHRGTRLNEYPLYELYVERVNFYDALSRNGYWDAIGLTGGEQKISFIEKYDFILNKPSEEYVKEYANIAKLLSEVRTCTREEKFFGDNIKSYLWNNFDQMLNISEIKLTDAMKIGLENFKTVYDEKREIYNKIAEATNVPPVLIAAIHYRESGSNFDYSIRNGQTKVSGTKEFIEDAIDEFTKLMPSKGIEITSDAPIRVMLTYAELHNGVAYAKNGHINPYLYSGTNIYISGKYVEKKAPDGTVYTEYDEDQVDAQIGLYALITSIDKKEWYLNR